MKGKYQHTAIYLCPECKRVERVTEQYYNPAMRPKPPRCCGRSMLYVRRDQSGG